MASVVPGATVVMADSNPVGVCAAEHLDRWTAPPAAGPDGAG
jgi:hypothetical protein